MVDQSLQSYGITYENAGYGYDVRAVQDLLGHKDVKTTMIYPHVLRRGPFAVVSPLDGAP